MKTPEEMAEEWCAEHTCHLQMTCHAEAFLAGYHTGYNIAYELGFEEALKAQKTLTYIQAEIKKNNENS